MCNRILVVPFLVLFINTIGYAQIDFSETLLIKSPLLTKMDSLVKEGNFEDITSILIAKDGKLLY